MLSILEYSDVGSTQRGSLPTALEPPIAKQALDVGPNSTQSEPFNPATCIVKLSSDEDCLIDVGLNPDASNSLRKLKAGIEKDITVPVGANFRIAVMASNSGSVTAMDSLESLLKLIASPADAQKQFSVMQDQVAKFTLAAQELKAAGDEHKTMQADLAKATQEALDVKASADKATAELAQREAAFDKDSQDHADKVKADQAALDERSKALDAREAELRDGFTVLGKRTVDLADLAVNLGARGDELSAREAALNAAEADYTDRTAKITELAKPKALTA